MTQKLADAWQFTVGVKTQAETDAVVDALRNAGISIAELKEQRATLEDAFLALVGDQA